MSETGKLGDEVARMISMLPSEELSRVVKQGALLRLPHLEGRLLQAERQIKHFEVKYRTTIRQLKAGGLPDDADHTMHEDFIEWEYWDDIVSRSKTTIGEFRKLLEKMEENPRWGSLSPEFAKSAE